MFVEFGYLAYIELEAMNLPEELRGYIKVSFKILKRENKN